MSEKNEFLLREKKVELAVNITEPLDPREITYHIEGVSRRVARGFFSLRGVEVFELEETFTYEFEGRVARPELMEGYWVKISVGSWPPRNDGLVGDGMLKENQFDLRLRLPPQMAKTLFEHLLRWSNAPKDRDLFLVENPTGLTGQLWDFTCGLERFKQGLPTNDKAITFQISGAYF